MHRPGSDQPGGRQTPPWWAAVAAAALVLAMPVVTWWLVGDQTEPDFKRRLQADGNPAIRAALPKQKSYKLRRRFWFRLEVPAVVLAILVGGYVVVFGLRQATLSPDLFDTVRIGQSQTSIEARLPAGTPDPLGDFGPVPAPPDGTTCRYYVPRSGGWVDFDNFDPNRVFRLCYRDGRLVTREVLHKAGPRR